MQSGCGGIGLNQAERASSSSAGVNEEGLLITGMPSVESAVFGLRNQAFDYLAKPFSVEDVHQLLQRVREERRSRPQPAPLAPGQDVARRQAAVEGLSYLGDLALQGLDPFP